MRSVPAARAKEESPREAHCQSGKLVREFVEDYHEKLEEDFLFPEFEKRKSWCRWSRCSGSSTTRTARLTGHDSQGVNRRTVTRQSEWSKIVAVCEAFIRMYGPHAAREDTVLFPALRKILSAKQLDELGDKFEAEENRRFGAGGFEKIVEQVAAIEKQLGIYDLAQFTPKAK